VVKYLVEQGADIHAKNDGALKWSAAKGCLEVVKYLVEQGADIHSEDEHALRYSARNGNLNVVKYLIESGANIYVKNEEILKIGVGRSHLEIIKFVIIDCNMLVKEDTFKYLQDNAYQEVINIIKARDFHNQLDNNLNSNIADSKNKKKKKI
jgi:ankyrin repeat protein